jgi:8-oxo-dGTP pyrophosphatase MutT (NUDIX family)
VCGSGTPGPDGVVREFTVATFVVHEGRVLLLYHPKHSIWLPPGGHIEHGELPDEAAVREVVEETGVRVRLVGERGVDVEYPYQLIRPYGIQVENIRPGVQHIDLVYFAAPLDDEPAVSEECAARDRAGWYDASEIADLGANHEIQQWVAKATHIVAAARDAGR